MPNSSIAIPDYESFKIGFHPEDQKKVHAYWDEIFQSQKWTEGKFVQLFEEKWEKWNGISAVATSSWAGGALAVLEFFNVKGKKVLCPTNTFMATPLSVIKTGGEVVFGDCNKEDLCLSYDSVVKAANTHQLGAVWLVHIGGHLAFDTERIAAFCKEKKIPLIEDCAHAHGASWNGRKPGSFGDAGVFSFYATKSISTGEGGILVSKNKDLIEYAKKFRNYGKMEYVVSGLNYRMSEFTAALGCAVTDRLEEITSWKNEIAEKYMSPKYSKKLKLPAGMISGLYKYIVFEPVPKTTGKVYDLLCHTIMKVDGNFPNAVLVSQNHWCPPLYYNPK